MSTPRKNPKKTDPKQMQLDLTKQDTHIHIHLHLDELLRAPFSKLDMRLPVTATKMTPDVFQKAIEPAPAKKLKKQAKPRTPETLRELVVKQVKILAYQAGKEVRTVWTDAYRELFYLTGIDAPWLSSVTRQATHLDVVEKVGQLEQLLSLVMALRHSPEYNPSVLV